MEIRGLKFVMARIEKWNLFELFEVIVTIVNLTYYEICGLLSKNVRSEFLSLIFGTELLTKLITFTMISDNFENLDYYLIIS